MTTAFHASYTGQELESLVAYVPRYLEDAREGYRTTDTYHDMDWDRAVGGDSRATLVLRAMWHRSVTTPGGDGSVTSAWDRQLQVRFALERTPDGWRVASDQSSCPPSPDCI